MVDSIVDDSNLGLMDKLLRCGRGNPKTRALAGFHLLRIILAMMIAHSGIGETIAACHHYTDGICMIL